MILTPQAMTDPTQTAEQLKPFAKLDGKPVLASWMGGADVAAGEEILNRANIPTFAYPDTAARVFNYMWRYTYNLRGLYETPTLPDRPRRRLPPAAREAAQDHRGSAQGRPHDPDRVRVQAGCSRPTAFPTVETQVAASADEAATHARRRSAIRWC